MKILILIQNTKNELVAALILMLIIASVSVVGFLITRAIVLWYWRINDMINKQDAQIQEQMMTNHLLSEQNKLLKQIADKKPQY